MTRTLVTVLLLLAWGGTGYWAGDRNRNNAWLAKQVKVERQAREALEAEVLRGQTAAGQFITARQAMQNSFSTLEGQFNELRAHGPLVVFRSSAVRSAAGDQSGDRPAGGATGASAAQTAALPESALPAPPVAPADVAAGVGLTLGAVWMWNSALAGADTPAGACGAADPTAPACAADSGLGFEAAWDNHAANAKTCAVDRLQLQRLIDFVTTGIHP
jgi:hypothetical protein